MSFIDVTGVTEQDRRECKVEDDTIDTSTLIEYGSVTEDVMIEWLHTWTMYKVLHRNECLVSHIKRLVTVIGAS